MAEHTVFVVSVPNGSRRVRSQRKSVDWGTMGPPLGGAYECYAHISRYKYEICVNSSVEKLISRTRSLRDYCGGLNGYSVLKFALMQWNLPSQVYRYLSPLTEPLVLQSLMANGRL